jgi:hypothetical protein
MLVINASLNKGPVFSGTDATELYSLCSLYGLPPMKNVFDAAMLMYLIDRNKDKPLLIFSNFPPNFTYKRNDTYVKKFVRVGIWSEYTYKFSANLFKEAGDMLGPDHYIHFITSASPKVGTQKKLQKLLPGSSVTVKYNDEFWETAYSPYEAYLNYFAEKIKEFSLLKHQS